MKPPVPEEILAEEAAAITVRYKVSDAEARDALLHAFARRTKLLARIAEGEGAKVRRSADYRRAVSEARARVYYSARRYKREEAALDDIFLGIVREAISAGDKETLTQLAREALSAHSSTRERLSDYPEFLRQQEAAVGSPTSIIDVGSGLHPLAMITFPTGPVERYLSIDRDVAVIRTLEAFAPSLLPTRLRAVHQDLASLDWTSLREEPSFDLGLLLKVVPVLMRQDRQLADRLVDVPADCLLVTGNVESLTRREQISRRERALLKRFVSASGRPVLAELDLPSEFGYFLGPPTEGT